MSRIVIYIAGPMRGIKNANKEAFHDAAERLRSRGYEVINPVELNGEQDRECDADFQPSVGELWDCMKTDLIAIGDRCDAICMLPGWENSLGAQAEVALARFLGIRVLPDWFIDGEPPTGTELRSKALTEVRGCVCRDRQNTYGDAEDNFADIAKFANVMLRRKLSTDLDPTDVALFSLCIKMARLSTSPEHRDNWIDTAGYSVCGAGILERMDILQDANALRTLCKNMASPVLEVSGG